MPPIAPESGPVTRTLKMVLEYEGGAYQGWQYQPDVPTIQGEIEARLARILGAPHRIHGAGRTDAGVHARGQVAHLHTVHSMAVETLQRALNATLPRDIAVRSLVDAAPDFHARKQAHRKLYAYQILNRPHRSALLDRYSWHIRQALDFEGIAGALSRLLGEHDFAAFRASDCGAKTTVRRIDECRITQMPDELFRIEIEGSGFLKHMVRTIVGTVVDVGLHRRTVEDFQRILEGRDRRLAGRTAPARGLWLEWVSYGDEGPQDEEDWG